MASRRHQPKQNANMPDVPEDLADGEAFSVIHTVRKERNKDEPNAQSELTAADLTDSEWYIEIQTESGWAFKDEMEGRPTEPDLRNNYGPGKYRISPVLNGSKLTQFREVLTILPATGTLLEQFGRPLPEIDDSYDEEEEEEEMGSHHQMPSFSTGRDWQDAEMPAWMRMQIQQAQEERAEARRRQEESERRREEWERQQAQREWERQEREERWAREKAQREEQERKERLEREDRERKDREERDRKDREAREAREARAREERNQMIQLVVSQGAGLVGTFLQSQSKPVEKPDINEALLHSLLDNRRQRPEGSSLRDQIEMLALLDSLRAAREEPKGDSEPPQKDSGGDLISNVLKLAPLLGLGMGGGAPAGPTPQQLAALQQQMAQPQVTPPAQISEQKRPIDILSNEEEVAKAAVQDPDAVAKAVMGAVKKNPILEGAVMRALTENEQKG